MLPARWLSWLAFVLAHVCLFSLYHYAVATLSCSNYAMVLKYVPFVTSNFLTRVRSWCVWDTPHDALNDFVTLSFPSPLGLISGTQFRAQFKEWQGFDVVNKNSSHRIMHHMWRDRTIPVFAARPWLRYLESWLRCFPPPGWTHVFWTDAELLRFVVEIQPDFLSVYQGFGSNIMRSDSARVLLLSSYGGLYADMDYECFRNFDEVLSSVHSASGLALLQVPVMKGLQNSLMFSRAGHPFWERVKHFLQNQPRFVMSMHSKTGSNLLVAANQDLGFPAILLPDQHFGYSSRKGLGGYTRHHGSSSWSWQNHRTHELRLIAFCGGIVYYLVAFSLMKCICWGSLVKRFRTRFGIPLLLYLSAHLYWFRD
eukprot:gb/GEZN01008170.1/.p1 GENE.gb/GEZN01008170.1/~~gb/GEZN01008170.1/.p1  ORF type:complete len:368 (+),score=16.00 gb/GEZN01008170.1/:5-1108(+)